MPRSSRSRTRRYIEYLTSISVGRPGYLHSLTTYSAFASALLLRLGMREIVDQYPYSCIVHVVIVSLMCVLLKPILQAKNSQPQPGYDTGHQGFTVCSFLRDRGVFLDA